MSTSEPRLHKGQVFADRYVVAETLGKGGMGAVYRARDMALGEDVALKVLAPLSGASPVALLRFRQEVKLSRRVTHPNVVRVYDIGELDGLFYMTMELVNGQTLAQYIRKEGRLPAEEVARIGAGICAGLSSAHAAEIVHRDLKPANVLIEEGGRVVLSDFGIARSLVEDSDFTQEGMLVGTLKYMAPEQMTRRPVINARTDIYALGLLLYEALTGELPDRTGRPNDPISRGARGSVDVLARLGKILLSCIEPNPDLRPGSAEEMGRAFAELGAGRMADSEILTNEIEIVRDEKSDLAPNVAIKEAKAGQTAMMQRTSLTELSARSSLAVLPLSFQGPAEYMYLGSTVADELVDMLVQIQGFRVIGTATTQAFSKERDPRGIGKALGVAMVLDGSIQLAAGGLARTVVRLFDAGNGAQLWSEKQEGTVSDVFSFQVAIARKIAERLRVEISVLSYHGELTPEAIGHYLLGRRYFRLSEPEALFRTVQEFGRCVELAPGFLPAVAKHALSTVMCWFFDQGVSREIDWESITEARVSKALIEAPNLAETHLASAMIAAQRCQFQVARAALDQSLAIAPMCLDTLEYAGMLECEAGHTESGIERLEIARDLDVTRFYASVHLAKTYALLGDDARADGLLAEAAKRSAAASFGVAILSARRAMWRRDPGLLRLGDINPTLDNPRWAIVRLVLRVLRGQADVPEVEQEVKKLFAGVMSPRTQAAVHLILADVWLFLGQTERALICVLHASRLGLLDLLWLTRGALLAPLRDQPPFVDALRRAHSLAESMRP